MLKVLLIDDDYDEFELFASAMKYINEEVSLIHSDGCTEVLDVIIHHRPDLVFIDINMPSVNGIDCLKSVRAHADFESLRVVMYSTSSNKMSIEQSFVNKANYYVVKPYSYQGIVRVLQKVINTDWTDLKDRTLENFLIAG